MTGAFPILRSAMRSSADMPIRLVSSIYKPDKALEAVQVCGADDLAHPAVNYLHKSVQEFYVGGSVQAISSPQHFDYVALRCASSMRFLVVLPS